MQRTGRRYLAQDADKGYKVSGTGRRGGMRRRKRVVIQYRVEKRGKEARRANGRGRNESGNERGGRYQVQHGEE